MRMKIVVQLLAACSLALLAGCFNFEIAKSPDFCRTQLLGNDGMPIAHVITSNYGWYLFNCIPIITGNAREGASSPWVMFRDDVTLDILQNRLVTISEKMQADLVDVHTSYIDTCMLPIPYVNTTFGLLWYKEIQISSVLTDPMHAATGIQEKRQRRLRREMNDLIENLEEKE